MERRLVHPPRFNPNYPDRIPARIKPHYLVKPAPVQKAADVRPAICTVCDKPFRAYFAVEHTTPSGTRRTMYLRRYTLKTCSPECTAENYRTSMTLTVAAQRGIDPNLLLRSSALPGVKRLIPPSRRRRRFDEARHAALIERYVAGTIEARHFAPKLTLPTATIAAITLMTKPDIFNPHQAARLRSRIYDIVEKSLDDAGKALSTDPDNKRQMTTSQVSLFKALLAKVVPDLSASFNVNDTRRVPADQLPRETLERLALGDTTLDIEIVEPPKRLPTTPEPNPTPTPTPNPPNTPEPKP